MNLTKTALFAGFLVSSQGFAAELNLLECGVSGTSKDYIRLCIYEPKNEEIEIQPQQLQANPIPGFNPVYISIGLAQIAAPSDYCSTKITARDTLVMHYVHIYRGHTIYEGMSYLSNPVELISSTPQADAAAQGTIASAYFYRGGQPSNKLKSISLWRLEVGRNTQKGTAKVGLYVDDSDMGQGIPFKLSTFDREVSWCTGGGVPLQALPPAQGPVAPR
jgi:hypothetical protein